MGLIRALVQHGSAQVSAKLGRCPKCMGLSLSGAIIGWIVLAAVLYFWPQFPFANLLTVWPLSFTALWVLHITIFGGRAVACARRETSGVATTEPAAISLISRRRMVGVFARSVCLGVLVSAAVSANAFAAPSKPFCTCTVHKPFCGGCTPCPGSSCHPGDCTPVSTFDGRCF